MNSLHLALRYVLHHRGKTLLLALSLALVLLLPLAVRWLTESFQTELVRRAQTTPLLLGAKGSRYDLTLAALYFEGRSLEPIPIHVQDRLENARAVPIFLKHRAKNFPIVGTTLDYFDARQLPLARGHLFGRLGDTILGANVAAKLDLAPGDYILSDPQSVFNIAGSYPLRLRVTGILAQSHTPDDNALFVDLKTAWIIEGIGHGHQDVRQADPTLLLGADQNKIVASAGITSYTEITDDNIDSFHFHGNPDDFPISALLLFPSDDRQAALLAGKFLAPGETVQVQRPMEVIAEMFAVVFRVKRFFDAQSLLVALATLLLLALIVSLSVRLRERELATYRKIGAAKGMVARLLIWEWVLVTTLALLLVSALLTLLMLYAPSLLRLALFA